MERTYKIIVNTPATPAHPYGEAWAWHFESGEEAAEVASELIEECNTIETFIREENEINYSPINF